jgi:two-component system cell cycle sensor histidine kinase/response regulator CckA
LLQRQLATDERTGRLLAAPLHLLEEAAQLIAKLLSRASDREAKREWIDVNQVLRDLTDLLRQVAGRAIALSVEPAAEQAVCRLDPTLLKSALLNLVVNARQAMRQGGAIMIRTETVTVDAEAAAAMQLSAPGCYLAIVVADDGRGIPADRRARIFEPFVDTDDRETGSEISLNIIRGFVTSSEGQIIVDSVAGIGTTFTMYFPLRHEAMPRG